MTGFGENVQKPKFFRLHPLTAFSDPKENFIHRYKVLSSNVCSSHFQFIPYAIIYVYSLTNKKAFSAYSIHDFGGIIPFKPRI